MLKDVFYILLFGKAVLVWVMFLQEGRTFMSKVVSSLARLFLLPGDIACVAIGLDHDDKQELVRMLVNSLVWIVVGMAVAAALI